MVQFKAARGIAAIFAAVGFVASAEASSSFAGLTFHSSVPDEQRTLLKGDMVFLSELAIDDSKAGDDLRKAVELKKLNGSLMHNWIINRTRFIVGQSYALDKELVDGGPYAYESDDMPNDGHKAVVNMSNVGAAVYALGKRKHRLAGLNLDGMMVYFTSPRVGLLRVGQGLFESDPDEVLGRPTAPAARLARLATLSHESRHSDGHGSSLSFRHITCPEGHPYEGKPACDTAANGAYSLDSSFLKATIDTCKACTSSQKEALRAQAFDYAGRLIAPKSVQKKIDDLSALISGNEFLIETFKTLLIDKKSKASERAKVKGEIAKLAKQNNELINKLAALGRQAQSSAPKLDTRPEGKFNSISLTQSAELLKAQ